MLNSRSKKRAMTLAELLICIGIIGIIAAITLPVLRKVIPTKEDSFHKKVNYTIEQVVTQLYDDESMYPRKSDFYSQGFQNTEKVTINGIEYGGDKNSASAQEQRKAKEKFCRLFASKFEISSETNLVCENQTEETATSLARGKRSFRAKDNVDWYLPVTDFSKGTAEIMVDVNNDDPPNCIEGSNGCNNPDRFLYYVKPNGAITYTKPDDVVKNKFKIDVVVTTDGCAGGTCTETGGTYSIATLSNSGAIGAYRSNAAAFQNLDGNTRYVLKAQPKTGYYTDWSLNQKRIKIYNSDLVIPLKFHKKANYCVIVDYTNCDKSDVTGCATAKLTSGCGYKEVADKSGYYKLNDDGAYEYVGLGVSGGKYNYVCGGLKDAYGNDIPSNTYTLSKKGHPVINETTGAITSDTSYNAVYQCDNLTTGDYKLVITPQSGYKVPPITTANPNGKYEQNIRLGTDNVNIEITLQR